MIEAILPLLFGQDDAFVSLRKAGAMTSVQTSLHRFWSDAAFDNLPYRADLCPGDYQGLLAGLQALAGGRLTQVGFNVALWRRAAEDSQSLAQADPVAGALAALQAMAAWTGALGEQMTLQPWQGHDPGWHVFPLITARNLVAAKAIWSARYICGQASDFIEAAKFAPFDPVLQAVVSEYQRVQGQADSVYTDAVDELAWDFQANAGVGADTFRADLAALFWTTGDVLHAGMLRADGPRDYIPSYALVRDLVDQSLRALPNDPLLQFIWLDMKDRGPFSLRDHGLLFGRINNVYHGHPLHDLPKMGFLDVCPPFARCAIGWMRGGASDGDVEALFEAMSLAAEVIKGQAPESYIRITALAALINGDADQGRWAGLANMCADVLKWADLNGLYQPFDHVLDSPFYSLDTSSAETLDTTLDMIEEYRKANLGYWLTISPPLIQNEAGAEWLKKESDLLRELRAARFIRLLPNLPAHYRRYGMDVHDLEAPPPPGAKPISKGQSPLGYDPFDQRQAQHDLRQARERLVKFYLQLHPIEPVYAAARLNPRSSAKEFAAALGAHRFR